MKRLLPLALALSACATMPSVPPDAVARAQAAFDRARPYAEGLLPDVSPERANRIRLALQLTQAALSAAAIATTAADRLAELRKAEAGMAVVAAPE